MAKSARSSSTKRNRSNLRAKVFGPASDARIERLSAKLMEIASTPKPDRQDTTMDVDKPESTLKDPSAEKATTTEMDVDNGVKLTDGDKKPSKPIDRRAIRKAKRVIRKKPRNSIIFESIDQRRKRAEASKSKRR